MLDLKFLDSLLYAKTREPALYDLLTKRACDTSPAFDIWGRPFACFIGTMISSEDYDKFTDDFRLANNGFDLSYQESMCKFQDVFGLTECLYVFKFKKGECSLHL